MSGGALDEGPSRPLPRLEPETAWFWTSGCDGVLRLQRCTGCRRFVHPSLPVCPQCPDGELLTEAVSGHGSVIAFTVNHQQWLPRFDPPYVIAVVALDEQPDVRLTTNVVDCDPEVVAVGMRVGVRFVQQGPVWIPVFGPLGEPAGAPVVAEPAVWTRPRASADKFEERVAVTGIGMSAVGRRLLRPPLSLAAEAARAAVHDAGLTFDDIDGVCTYPGPMTYPGMSEGGVGRLEEVLGLHPTWFNGGIDQPGQAGVVVAAMLAVAAGLCRHVLCVRTLSEASSAELRRSGRIQPDPPGVPIDGDAQWRLPFGAASASNWIALAASAYFHRYGADRSMLAAIALNARTNAARNPDAIYREPLTLEQYLGARLVSTPFGLYDCDVPCDGSVALVVSAREAATDLRHRPVLVEAVGTQMTERQSWDQGTITHEPNVFGPAAHLWSRTDLGPGDVDVAELYDGFTFNCVSWLEGLGFCGLGEAQDWLEGGRRIALDGELPVNTHGGQLSAGRLHGFGFIHEAVVQLRGHGGDRQVADAEVAVVSTGGGSPGGALLLVAG